MNLLASSGSFTFGASPDPPGFTVDVEPVGCEPVPPPGVPVGLPASLLEQPATRTATMAIPNTTVRTLTCDALSLSYSTTLSMVDLPLWSVFTMLARLASSF